jgi:hypothetical protein
MENELHREVKFLHLTGSGFDEVCYTYWAYSQKYMLNFLNFCQVIFEIQIVKKSPYQVLPVTFLSSL